jgi:hypothetical protein
MQVGLINRLGFNGTGNCMHSMLAHGIRTRKAYHHAVCDSARLGHHGHLSPRRRDKVRQQRVSCSFFCEKVVQAKGSERSACEHHRFNEIMREQENTTHIFFVETVPRM